jgi:hypothetical protein
VEDKNDDDEKEDLRLAASLGDVNSDAFRSSSIAALRARAQQHSEKLQQQQHHHNLHPTTQDIWNSVARIGQQN